MGKITEWMKMWQARSWMKRNEGFLPTWHAYLGYKMNLFAGFAEGATVDQVVASTGYDRTLLDSWIEVGLAVGQLQRTANGGLRPSKQMLKYFDSRSPVAVGELLVEMLELHIPALLQYPQMMAAGGRCMFDEQHFARTVAATSSFIEEAAFPVLRRWVKKQHCRTILDVGCGYAGYLLRFARSNASLKLFGIEKDHALLEAAQSLAEREHLKSVHLLQGDFLQSERQQWPSESPRAFDLVMMNNILYYIAPDRRPELLHRAADMLAPGGTLTIISPLRPSQKSLPFSAAFNTFMRAHENLYDLPSIQEIEQCGRQSDLHLISSEPLIREGNWYFCGLRKTGTVVRT